MGYEGLHHRINRARWLIRAGLLWAVFCVLQVPFAAEIDGSPAYAIQSRTVLDQGGEKAPAGSSVRTGAEPGPIRVTIKDAILMALENNQALSIERINPAIQKTYEQQEQGVFDPLVSAEVAGERERAERIRSGLS